MTGFVWVKWGVGIQLYLNDLPDTNIFLQSSYHEDGRMKSPFSLEIYL